MIGLPKRPLRYAIVFTTILLILLFYVQFSAVSNLSENANPENDKDANGNTKEPGLAPGIGQVIDTHRGEINAKFDFPGIIHQTAKKNNLSPARLSWAYANPGEEHKFYSDADATKFVKDHCSTDIYEVYVELRSSVAKADLFRYLLLREMGGVYADVDTTTLCPIKAWIPEEFYVSDINLVVGVEVDEPSVTSQSDLDKWGWSSNFQFVQWTILAKPGHDSLNMVVNEVLKRLKTLAESHGKPIRNIDITQLEVIRTTGPGAFTTALLAYLGLEDASSLRGLTEPKLVKDVLIMPVSSFAPNQHHSKSKSVKYAENVPEVLVMHGFAATRTWADDVKFWLASRFP